MRKSHSVTMLGAGLIGTFYTMTIQGRRSRDRVGAVCAKTEEEAAAFARKWGIPRWTSEIWKAVEDPETDPVYTPKTLKSLASVRAGALGRVLWVRSRETHPGPHSAWFWDRAVAGGGAIVDMGCHCIEIIRSFIGKGVRPVEVLCAADTLVHPIDAEDSGIGLIRFENRAIGRFEVSWTFRGGMDLRDEVHELGYVDMFDDMFDALDEGRPRPSAGSPSSSIAGKPPPGGTKGGRSAEAGSRS